MKARPVSPHRLKIRQMELEIEELRRLDAEWRADRNAKIIAETGKSQARVARRYGLTQQMVHLVQSQACGGA